MAGDPELHFQLVNFLRVEAVRGGDTVLPFSQTLALSPRRHDIRGASRVKNKARRESRQESCI